MRKYILVGLFLLTVALPGTLTAQKLAVKTADKYFDQLAYSQAVDMYLKILKKDSTDLHVISRIANAYYNMGEYEKSFPYFQKLCNSDSPTTDTYYKYAQVLKVNENYTEALKWLKIYQKLNPEDRRAKIQIEKIDQIEKLRIGFKNYQIKNVTGNTRFIDMCPVFTDGGLVFASARDSFSVRMRRHNWNNQPFLDLYVSENLEDISNAQKLSGDINTRFHEGPVCFSSDGQTAYFTRNNFVGGKKGETPDGINNLKIFIAHWDGKEWGSISEFPYNSDEYSVGHAALAKDNSVMYFVSNMPGGYGETDIYKTELKNGEWTEPTNLGEKINTEGREMFPFVDKNGVLYFSSDGQAGLGGLDIFAAVHDDENYSIINVGEPLNSSFDDFALAMNSDCTQGMLSSNRTGGLGNDDIYSFKIGSIKLEIVSIDSETNKKLPGTKIKLFDKTGKNIDEGTTNNLAIASFNVKPVSSYKAIGSKADYETSDIEIKTGSAILNSVMSDTIYLQKQQMTLSVKIVDKNSEIINGADLKIESASFNDRKIDLNEVFTMDVNKNNDYHFIASAKGYFVKEALFSVSDNSKLQHELLIQLDKIEKNKTVVLENIYYDVNKSDIRPDAAKELDKLVELMKENPKLKIELSSHTDCRAANWYNNLLSQRRADSAVKYLVSKGISANRLVAKGYGESKLINKCSDGVDCTEEEHQQNRRTEIKILDN